MLDLNSRQISRRTCSSEHFHIPLYLSVSQLPSSRRRFPGPRRYRQHLSCHLRKRRYSQRFKILIFNLLPHRLEFDSLLKTLAGAWGLASVQLIDFLLCQLLVLLSFIFSNLDSEFKDLLPELFCFRSVMKLLVFVHFLLVSFHPLLPI